MKRIQKKRELILYILCVIVIFCISFTNAQSQRLCGSYIINKAQLQKALEFEKENSLKTQSTHYLIRVYFHICRNNDGTNAGATKDQLASELVQLISDYAADNVCFIQMGTDFVDNTQINTNLDPDNSSNVQWLYPYLIPNCINIFYHAYLLKYGGNAYNIPNTFFSVDRGNIGQGHTIAHEMGHCFGLFHTFEPANGYEDIDGSNSATTADQIVDTHADPYVFKGQPCFSTFGGVYIGNCTDPKGQKNYDPPYTNLMAYWWIYGYANLSNTADQFIRVNSFLNTNSSLLACESAANITFGPVNYSSGYVMTSALNSLTTSGAVNLSGTTIATLGGQTVFLENGFSAIPSSGGLISIEPSSCNFTFNKFAYNISGINNGELSNSAKLIVYPNPTSSFVHLDFTTNKNESNVAIQVFNPEMKEVKEIRLGNLIKGKQAVTINLNNLSSGIYYMRLQLNNEYLNAKIVLIK